MSIGKFCNFFSRTLSSSSWVRAPLQNLIGQCKFLSNEHTLSLITQCQVVIPAGWAKAHATKSFKILFWEITSVLQAT